MIKVESLRSHFRAAVALEYRLFNIVFGCSPSSPTRPSLVSSSKFHPRLREATMADTPRRPVFFFDIDNCVSLPKATSRAIADLSTALSQEYAVLDNSDNESVH